MGLATLTRCSSDEALKRKATRGLVLLACMNPEVVKCLEAMKDGVKEVLVLMQHSDARLVCAATSALQNLAEMGVNSKLKVMASEAAVIARTVQLLNHSDLDVVLQALALVASITAEPRTAKKFFEEAGALSVMMRLMGHRDRHVCTAASALVMPLVQDAGNTDLLLVATHNEPDMLRGLMGMLRYREAGQVEIAASMLADLTRENWNLQVQVRAGHATGNHNEGGSLGPQQHPKTSSLVLDEKVPLLNRSPH
jgi:hypothetical protein